MRIEVILLTIIAGIVSCRKEPRFYDFSPFKNRYLVCDSLQITKNGTSATLVLGKGKGYDVRFAENYTIYSNPNQTFSYADPATIRFSEYRDQQYSKIYYYAPGTDFHLGDYLIIEAVANNRITLLHRDLHMKEQKRYFFTAE